MTERLEQRVTAGTPGELGELCAWAAELVRGLPGPVRRVALRTGDHGVDIEWSVSTEPATDSPAAAPAPAPPQAAGDAAIDGVPAGQLAHVVRAPLVGTFYTAPQPGAPPFVVVGDAVEPGQTLGMVEAMKLMNHVTAETAGRVLEILVGNQRPVEFDQPLVRLAPL
jgi:acetyl-CoA carboxylase biotin carboxyl carrier protein